MKLFFLIGFLEFIAGLVGGYGFAHWFYGEPTGLTYTFIGLAFASGYIYFFITEETHDETKHV